MPKFSVALVLDDDVADLYQQHTGREWDHDLTTLHWELELPYRPVTGDKIGMVNMVHILEFVVSEVRFSVGEAETTLHAILGLERESPSIEPTNLIRGIEDLEKMGWD